MKTGLLLVPLATMSLLLAACTEEVPDDLSGARPEATQSSALEGSTARPGSSSRGKDPVQPAKELTALDQYLGVGAGVVTTSGDSADREVEEAIARCMAAEGFDYVPYVLSSTMTRMGDGTYLVALENASLPDLPPAEFAAQYGYGISTRERAEVTTPDVDPNEAVVEQMSVAERIAYQQALYGRAIELDSQGRLRSSVTIADDSCMGKAERRRSSADQDELADRVTDVENTFAALLRRVGALKADELADPRMAVAEATWSQCLTRAGFSGFTSLDAPYESIVAQAKQVLGEDLDAAGADPGRVAALRRKEVRLAVADEACLAEWRQAFEIVRRDLEKRFVEANLEELKAYRSAMSAALSPQD